MESPFWLPPLYSHGNYTTLVSVSQPTEPMLNPECSEESFLIKVFVDVTFYSEEEMNRNSLKGLYIRNEFLTSCRSMINSSQKDVKKLVSEILGYMRVPFELDHILYTERPLKKPGSKMLKRKCNFTPETTDSWLVKMQQFLHGMTQESQDAGHNVFLVNIRIKKMIRISPDEFETWISWFREKKRGDPTFPRTYLREICRPRTIQELLEAENRLKGAEKSALAALEDASSFIKDESTTNWQCMVCLEELSAGCEASRLPCSHVFHKACIHKWLQESNLCPLCRSALP